MAEFLQNFTPDQISQFFVTLVASLGGTTGIAMIIGSVLKYLGTRKGVIANEKNINVQVAKGIEQGVKQAMNNITATIQLDADGMIDRATGRRLSAVEDKFNTLAKLENENLELHKLIGEGLLYFKSINNPDYQARLSQAIGKQYKVVEVIEIQKEPSVEITKVEPKEVEKEEEKTATYQQI